MSSASMNGNSSWICLDLLKGPARGHESQQMGNGEPQAADARPTVHLRRIDRHPIEHNGLLEPSKSTPAYR